MSETGIERTMWYYELGLKAANIIQEALAIIPRSLITKIFNDLLA
jgi:hypothetical protein